jgi:hypothetical protein
MFSLAVNARHCNCWISATTRFAMLALPRSVVSWRTSLFSFLDELSLNFFGATQFFLIYNGALSRRVHV